MLLPLPPLLKNKYLLRTCGQQSKQRHSKLHIPISIVTILNRRDCSLAGYAQTKAICNALFDVMQKDFWK